MQGIERSYGDVCVAALISAWVDIMHTPAAELLTRSNYGKGDTMALDANPEIRIVRTLKEFDSHSLCVTEEEGAKAGFNHRWPTDSKPEKQPLMFFLDPTDRSKPFAQFIELISKDTPLERLGILMKNRKYLKIWENMNAAPVSITGATTSITCVRKGSVVFSVILNYINRTIYTASSSGIFSFRLPVYTDTANQLIDFQHIVKVGKPLNFLPTSELCSSFDDAKKFVTFIGKSGYKENFDDSAIFVEDSDEYIHYDLPGGPSRALYLSELQRSHGPVGFVMANGEKIGEWIHWLSFARFAKNCHGGPALKVYEISIERPWTKGSILMSTSPPYSIFRMYPNGCAYLDVSRLEIFDNPSLFRSMLVVVPSDNSTMIQKMVAHNYREIRL